MRYATPLRQKGFTIVELLIVIVIIAILAAITIVAYNGIQQRAKASAIVTDLKAIKKGLRLMAISEGQSTWWIDNELTGIANPTVTSIISSTNLKNYYPSVSSATLGATTKLFYDNEGDTYGGCSTTTSGVNLFMYTVDASTAQAVDTAVDDGNLSCGSVTYSGGNLRYSLSRTQDI